MSLVDVTETHDLTQLEKDLTEAVTATPAPDGQAPTEDASNDDRPDWIEEKFWTGSVEGSAEKQHSAYMSLQSAHGRMANDLGTQRKLTDRILNLEEKRHNDLEVNTPADELTISGADLLDKPAETLERYLSARDAGSQDATSIRLAELEGELAQNKFVARHADFNDVANSTEFSTWVNQNQYRLNLANAARENNWEAASILLDEFKATRPAPAGDETVDDNSAPNLTEEARQAGLESTSSSDSTVSRKIYSRAALMQLRVEKPNTYADPAFQEEIMLAYSEGRVK